MRKLSLILTTLVALALLSSVAFAATPRYRDLRICNLGETLVEATQHGAFVSAQVAPPEAAALYSEEMQPIAHVGSPDGMCSTTRFYSRAFELVPDGQDPPVDTITFVSVSVVSPAFVPTAYQALIRARVIPWNSNVPPGLK